MQCYKMFIIAGGASKNRTVVTSSSSDSIVKDAFYISKPISIIMVWIEAFNFQNNDKFILPTDRILIQFTDMIHFYLF